MCICALLLLLLQLHFLFSEMLPPDWEIVSRSFDFRPPTIGAMNIGSIGGVTPSQASHRGRRRALVDDRFSSHRTQHTAQHSVRCVPRIVNVLLCVLPATV